MRRTVILGLCAALACATPAIARTPAGLDGLVGVRGSSLDNAIGEKGYVFAKNVGAASMYWNKSQKICASVLVDNGRVASVQTATPGDCGHKGGILANALRDAEFNRGKSDAMANKPYAKNDSEEYHSGYMEGERMRGGGHAGHGAEPAHFNDLNGKNSIAAIDAMGERGFSNVDSMTMGNTQYGIYYNRATHQCVQLTMADGRVVSANDIGHHPNCH